MYNLSVSNLTHSINANKQKNISFGTTVNPEALYKPVNRLIHNPWVESKLNEPFVQSFSQTDPVVLAKDLYNNLVNTSMLMLDKVTHTTKETISQLPRFIDNNKFTNSQKAGIYADAANEIFEKIAEATGKLAELTKRYTEGLSKYSQRSSDIPYIS